MEPFGLPKLNKENCTYKLPNATVKTISFHEFMIDPTIRKRPIQHRSPDQQHLFSICSEGFALPIVQTISIINNTLAQANFGNNKHVSKM